MIWAWLREASIEQRPSQDQSQPPSIKRQTGIFASVLHLHVLWLCDRQDPFDWWISSDNTNIPSSAGPGGSFCEVRAPMPLWKSCCRHHTKKRHPPSCGKICLRPISDQNFLKKLQTLLLHQSTWPHASFIFSVLGKMGKPVSYSVKPEYDAWADGSSTRFSSCHRSVDC